VSVLEELIRPLGFGGTAPGKMISRYSVSVSVGVMMSSILSWLGSYVFILKFIFY
jgi:hypothetical protein